MITIGHIIAMIAAALTVVATGIGSTIGVYKATQNVAGLTAEQPDLFFKAFIISIFPSTAGIYGFVAAFLIVGQIGLLGGGPLDPMSVTQGMGLMLASLPIIIMGVLTSLIQSKIARASIQTYAKQPTTFAKGMMLTSITEIYAILGLIITIFLM